MKTSWRHICKTSWRCPSKMSWTCLEVVLKMSWSCLEDVLKLSWKRLKTYDQDEYIVLHQDVFWRRMNKANIFVLIKTSWKRLKDVFWRQRQKTSSRRLQEVFIKVNICWVVCSTRFHLCYYVFVLLFFLICRIEYMVLTIVVD